MIKLIHSSCLMNSAMDRSTVLFNESGQFIKAGFHGTVYKGVFNDKHVAVKKIKVLSSTELKCLLDLKHNGIVEFIGQFTDINPYLVFELCIGDLHSIKLSRSAAAKFSLQLLSAVSYIHSKGYIHGDIKPQNCLVDQHHTCKLTDFGFTVEVDENGVCQSNGRGYTSGYASLELIETYVYSPGSDVFALGATIYFALTREYLFIGLESESDDQVRANIKLGIFATQMKVNPSTGEMLRRYARVGNRSPIRISTDKRLEAIGEAGSMIREMIQINPQERPSCQELLQKNDLFAIANCTNIDEIFKVDTTNITACTEKHASFITVSNRSKENEVAKLQLKLHDFEQENQKLRNELLMAQKQLLTDIRRDEPAESIPSKTINASEEVAPVESTVGLSLKSQQRFHCRDCTKSFQHKSNLCRHARVHQALNIRCRKPECKKTFLRRDAMEEHYARVHTTTKKYKCSKCLQKFNHPYLRSIHFKTVHAEAKETEERNLST